MAKPFLVFPVSHRFPDVAKKRKIPLSARNTQPQAAKMQKKTVESLQVGLEPTASRLEVSRATIALPQVSFLVLYTMWF